MRESRLRKTTPGEKRTDLERNEHVQDTIQFLQSRAVCAQNTGAKAKDAQLVKKDEYLATIPCVRFWNVSVIMTGRGLEQFRMITTCDVSVPPTLVCCMVWCQVQWRCLWFCRNYLGLCIEGMPDPTHVTQRNLTLATEEGNYDGVTRRGLIKCNVKFGPWNGGAWMHDIHETACDLSENMDAGDVWLLDFWPLIRNSLKLPPEDNCRAGRQ